MSDILLATFNARYHHAAFGLRYLQANLQELAQTCRIIEFDLEKRPADALEIILSHNPRIVGVSVYIWNTRQTLELCRLLKALRPDITLVLGGPEVSHELEDCPYLSLADSIVRGEGDVAFRELCRDVLSGKPIAKIIQPTLPDLKQLELPYSLYDDDDLKHRTLYVESSRGCPFSCEFCLSSLDERVRAFPLDRFLAEMQKLIDRGARQFKFVDRTFNVNPTHSLAVLQFFLDRLTDGMFLHFEMVPDRLHESVRDMIAKFPPGSLQLEIGIQSFNDEINHRISRRQDLAKTEENLRFLREQTNAHIHCDLIAGLPGESLASFAQGFDRLLALRPHEIQLGILKRLRGAPIARHTQEFQMIYSPDAPYELLQNRDLDFLTMQRIKRMARYWDLYHNSGNFVASIRLLLDAPSPFARFMEFSDFLFAATGRTHELSLSRQFELLLKFLGESAGPALAADYLHIGRKDLPGALQPFARESRPAAPARSAPSRQARHLSA